MLKVLWLCSWYPNKISPFHGDFVQRHAQAASLYCNVYIIKLTPDPDATSVTKKTNIPNEWPHLTEILISYPKRPTFFGKLKSYFRWYSLYKKAVQEYIAKNGLPNLVHVHIPFKSGIIAQWIKKKYKIPYVVTEHWGGYNHVVQGNYYSKSRWYKNIINTTIQNAAALHSVSHFVGNGIQEAVAKVPFTIIPNAVNTKYFYFKNRPANEKFHLLHISDGASVKNLGGILAAFERLNQSEFNIKIIGLSDEMNCDLNIKYPYINFLGTVSYCEVAKHLQNADAMVLFSHIENSPCVIGEALCCGVPVIASNVGGIPELVTPDNSILVTPGNIDELVAAINFIKENKELAHNQKSAIAANEKFSFKKIGTLTSNWYKNILSSN